MKSDTIYVEIVAKPLSEDVEAYAEALQELSDYVDDTPWCDLAGALEVFSRAFRGEAGGAPSP